MRAGVVPPRPLTHDLLVNVVTALGDEIADSAHRAHRRRVYYATLDAIALGTGAEVLLTTEDLLARRATLAEGPTARWRSSGVPGPHLAGRFDALVDGVTDVV